MRRNLHRIKAQTLPKTPKSPADIIACFEQDNFMQTYGFTMPPDSKQFYVNTIVEANFSYTIFISQYICDQIKTFQPNQKKYLIDGTFKIVPYGSYKQLLIIHIEYDNHVSIQI